jgi:hypothetical protein
MTMLPKNKIISEQELEGWPRHWPPPCKFLGPLTFNLTSFKSMDSLSEHQVILGFKNRYGVKISENFFHKGLYLVDILRFRNGNDGLYDLVYDAPVPDPNWYLNSHEVFALSEEVAQWERPRDYATPDFPRQSAH